MLRGKTILIFGDPSTIVSWKYYALRDGTDHIETDKGEVLDLDSNHWTLYVNKKLVGQGNVATPPAADPLPQDKL
jgi:hypothetical protein